MSKIPCILISQIFQLILLSNLFLFILVPQTNVIITIRHVLCTLYNTKNIEYHITEELIFYADKIVVMSNSKNSRVFNFTILLKS